MSTGQLNSAWFTWSAIALTLAVIYFFIWPKRRAGATAGFRFLVLRWAHALTWLLLALSFILRGLSPTLNGAAGLIAAAGGLIYLLFMVMTFIVK
jgi:hypothetical protein